MEQISELLLWKDIMPGHGIAAYGTDMHKEEILLVIKKNVTTIGKIETEIDLILTLYWLDTGRQPLILIMHSAIVNRKMK